LFVAKDFLERKVGARIGELHRGSFLSLIAALLKYTKRGGNLQAAKKGLQIDDY